MALDVKVTLDGNADFRHPDHAELADRFAIDPAGAAGKGSASSPTSSSTERSALSETVPALVMSTLDVVAYAAEEFGGCGRRIS